jgi:hypothetical protein
MGLSSLHSDGPFHPEVTYSRPSKSGCLSNLSFLFSFILPEAGFRQIHKIKKSDDIHRILEVLRCGRDLQILVSLGLLCFSKINNVTIIQAITKYLTNLNKRRKRKNWENTGKETKIVIFGV